MQVGRVDDAAELVGKYKTDGIGRRNAFRLL